LRPCSVRLLFWSRWPGLRSSRNQLQMDPNSESYTSFALASEVGSPWNTIKGGSCHVKKHKNYTLSKDVQSALMWNICETNLYGTKLYSASDQTGSFAASPSWRRFTPRKIDEDIVGLWGITTKSAETCVKPNQKNAKAIADKRRCIFAIFAICAPGLYPPAPLQKQGYSNCQLGIQTWQLTGAVDSIREMKRRAVELAARAQRAGSTVL
jgi:hypothetical protein